MFVRQMFDEQLRFFQTRIAIVCAEYLMSTTKHIGVRANALSSDCDLFFPLWVNAHIMRTSYREFVVLQTRNLECQRVYLRVCYLVLLN